MPPQSTDTMHDRLPMSATDSPSHRASGIPLLCAWPVSGQYGLGSGILFYKLVAACLIARKQRTDQKRIARGHITVFCSCYTTRHNVGSPSKPRSRIHSRPRPQMYFQGLSGLPLSHADQWSYGDTCGLTCSEEEGPFSQMRCGAANNIYVVPAPTILTLGTATLISAACCIPPILSMVTSWKTVFKINWQARFHRGTTVEEDLDRPGEDTNNATSATVKRVETQTRHFFLVVIEVPINLALILAVLVIGERNLFSAQVRYQTEPMTSIDTLTHQASIAWRFTKSSCIKSGQWAPLAGGALALFKALHFRITAKKSHTLEDPPLENLSRCPSDCSSHRMEASNPWADRVLEVLLPAFLGRPVQIASADVRGYFYIEGGAAVVMSTFYATKKGSCFSFTYG